MGGILERVADDLTVVVASDHGNIEDVRVGHTLNPAIGLFIGSRHRELAAGIASLTDVAPRLLAMGDPVA